jgi:hypothetical protein
MVDDVRAYGVCGEAAGGAWAADAGVEVVVAVGGCADGVDAAAAAADGSCWRSMAGVGGGREREPAEVELMRLMLDGGFQRG